MSTTTQQQQQQQQKHQYIILFYKYHPLSPDRNVTEEYRAALETLCAKLQLRGRILVGCSETEGINGTLSSTHRKHVLAFTYALLDPQYWTETLSPATQQAVEEYRTAAQLFFAQLSLGSSSSSCLLMNSPSDFKWSSTPITTTSMTDEESDLFPDLNIKLVTELIGTGGAMANIPLDETAQGYLTPEQWHAELLKHTPTSSNNTANNGNGSNNDNDNSNNTVWIDCRNTKEYQIGHFAGSLDPQTTTFQQFPRWVQEHKHLLEHKQVRMYCTGGIRCEKASAYIRLHVPNVQDVKHLQGGIHKYLEAYGNSNVNINDGGDDDGGNAPSSSLWQGRNFVFDGRGAASAQETAAINTETGNSSKNNNSSNQTSATVVVGRCSRCATTFDEFDPACVCTVCREPVLVCLKCRGGEFHCAQHEHLRDCYFSNLHVFDKEQLQAQLQQLQGLWQEIAIGRRFRQKRKTLEKQMDRIQERLEELVSVSASDSVIPEDDEAMHCRSCGQVSCSGRCWGFYSLKRKEILEQHAKKQQQQSRPPRSSPALQTHPVQRAKKPRREQLAQEFQQLQIHSMLPRAHRDATTGVRVPPCTTRLLQCSIKAKWCGASVIRVLQEEFPEVSRRSDVLQRILQCGLIRVNGDTVVTAANAADLKLKSSDTLARIVHWHEAPVYLSEDSIEVTKVVLPKVVVQEHGLESTDVDASAVVYACSKPSSVPVHPAGPYLANSLSVMVEAQEQLPAQSLNPLHRTDRVTSGLTLCCTNPAVSRLFHSSLAQGHVRKLYLARVKGKFPFGLGDANNKAIQQDGDCGKWALERNGIVRVDAPVHTVDPSNGFRAISFEGKASQSLFRRISYCPDTDTSILSCCPITGRNHQLRVHLQWLGFSIIGDVQYGGVEDVGTARQQDAALDLMVSAMNTANEHKLDSLSDEDVELAKKGCPCCSGGKEGLADSFTEAQLLQRGHAIQLHALRYSIAVYPKKKKSKKAKPSDSSPSRAEEPAQPLAEIDFEVDLPKWAAASISLDDLGWLD